MPNKCIFLDVLQLIEGGSPEARLIVADLIYSVVRIPSDITDLVEMYCEKYHKPMPAIMKKGLARAFGKFNPEQLAAGEKPGRMSLENVRRMVMETK